MKPQSATSGDARDLGRIEVQSSLRHLTHMPNSGRRVLVYSCANLYVANGCDDRQFSPSARIGGVPSDAPMPCQGDSSNIFGLILGPGLEW